jgi:mono/diheme cytochrome c family protein
MKTSTHITAASLLFLFGAALGLAAPASENWDNNCAKCHGADGKGQTKIGKKLQVKDYTDATVQAGLKDDEIANVIANGVTDKTSGKEKMKAFKGDLSADEIKDLTAYIRKFKS